jgi:HPt (histidine-containing phosphotransfer) domain-containing protein
MDDYLAKPVSIASLAATLGRWLPHAAAVDAAPDARAGAGMAEGAAPGAPWASEAFPQLDHPPPLDPGVVDALTRGNAADARTLLGDFLSSTGEDLAVADAARDAGDFDALARQAHKVKGASRIIGALELAQCAEVLEQAARAADWRAAPSLAADMATAAERLRRHVAVRYPASPD